MGAVWAALRRGPAWSGWVWQVRIGLRMGCCGPRSVKTATGQCTATVTGHTDSVTGRAIVWGANNLVLAGNVIRPGQRVPQPRTSILISSREHLAHRRQRLRDDAPRATSTGLPRRHERVRAREIFKGGCYGGNARSNPVLVMKPWIRPGRYCIRLSRVLTRLAS